MAVRKLKPVTPGQRHKVIGTFEDITASVPEKSLVYGKRSTGGRNNTGKMTVRYIGGGHKQKYRLIDFKREKDGVPAVVKTIEYDPNRSARIALLYYADGEKRYIIAPNGLQVGATLMSGADAAPEIGNCLPLANILALLVLDERERLEVVHRDLLLAGERVVARDEHVQRRTEQRMKLQMLLAQHLADHVLVEVRQVDDADLRKHVRDLVDDVLRAGLTDRELVLVGLDGVDHLDERLDGEHVVLRGHGAQLLARLRVLVALLKQVGLVEHLARVAQEGLALLGHNDTLVGALKDMHTHLVFEIADRRGNRRLRHKEPARGLGDAAAFGNFDDISELLKLHSALPRRS